MPKSVKGFLIFGVIVVVVLAVVFRVGALRSLVTGS